MAGEFGSRSYFQAADYVVAGVVILASLAIGVYYGVKGGGQKTSASYILADRSMSLAPVTLSLLASYFSGISVQGFPADVYYHGPMILWILVPFVVGCILALVFFMPMYYRLGMTSVYEYLELRFNGVVKICGVFSFLLYSVLYMGLVTYTACVAATAVTGIAVEVAIVSLCAICAVYTVIGGIKAVLWTDSLQMLLMLATILAIIIKCTMHLGFSNIWTIASEGSRTNYFYFNSDLSDFYNGWSMISQWTYAGLLISNQYMVQRLVVCKSEQVARAALVSYMLGAIVFQILLVVAGTALYAYYEGCDPTTLGYTSKNDQIVPYFIVDVFSELPGVPGLLLSGLFGAALSTLSSVLNSNATLVGEHFVKPFWKGLSDTKYTVVLKVIVVISSVITIGTAFLVPIVGDAVSVLLTINGCTLGIVLALYLLGALFPCCGSKGAIVGFFAGLVVGVVLSIGCIVYQVPTENLPLSADVCLNETLGATTAAPVATSAVLHMWSTNASQTTPQPSGDDSRPVIFTLAKSWLSFFTCITTMVVALLVTLVTGKNDMSVMNPDLVLWRIRSSFVPMKVTMVEDEENLAMEQKDQESREDYTTGPCLAHSLEECTEAGNDTKL